MAKVIDLELDQPLLRYSEDGTIAKSLQAKIASQLFGTSQDIAIDTINDFLELVDHLIKYKDSPRDSPEVLAFFPTIDSGAVEGQMRKVGDTKIALAKRYPYTTRKAANNALELAWPTGSALNDVVLEAFPKTPQHVAVKGCSFRQDLNAYNLERIGGFQIKWTSSFKDHLALDEDTGTIVLYHFATVLRLRKQEEGQNSVFPAGLVDETCRTLALLLPPFDVRGKQWFIQADKRARGAFDGSAMQQSLGPRGREIESFEFWHHRLCAIAEAFDGVEPRGFKAWWFDRRSRVQWINFWIATAVLFLTIVFGLISSVTGLIQAYMSLQQ
ncbi:hypothetical protein B0J12DRAFT_230244 [Macrophomina phaseolina]|uniref:Uncharacterized protein n=1 Tax=Macrophomina phaseolina TaxID=35725 RepID=A0ABQ8GSZ6_9PEZI|nr:hypothetical protein B0J12DRAFT_230244 [Macrophomina phaseolina]